MDYEAAPFFAEVADGPQSGAAYWAKTSDGVRVRIGAWPLEDARGTVFLMPGRTEYIEKYGKIASELAPHGYAIVATDWRGQGLADRLLPDSRVGHVDKFSDYQKDVAEMVAVAEALDMPKPWHLLGHSMGGAIAMRALVEGMDVVSVTFTGPMWGILIAPVMRQLAWGLYYASGWAGQGHRLPPTTSYDNYVAANEFDGNMLTNDPEMWEYMKAQISAHPELTIGGPSMRWLGEALRECLFLMRAAPPPVPAICFVGEEEAIVDSDRMRQRMALWPGGAFQIVHGSKHEILVEGSEIRENVIQQMLELFARGESQANIARTA